MESLQSLAEARRMCSLAALVVLGCSATEARFDDTDNVSFGILFENLAPTYKVLGSFRWGIFYRQNSKVIV